MKGEEIIYQYLFGIQHRAQYHCSSSKKWLMNKKENEWACMDP